MTLTSGTQRASCTCLVQKSCLLLSLSIYYVLKKSSVQAFSLIQPLPIPRMRNRNLNQI